MTIKTEEFPLTKPTTHDTNLTNAQLVITRDAEGRHRIGQITYKSEEDLTQPHSCPHRHHQHPNPSSPALKIKSVRGTGRLSSSTSYQKQSSPSTDQDYSSYTLSTSLETKPSTHPTRSYKPEPTLSQYPQSKVLHDSVKDIQSKKKSPFAFSEGFIENIDGYITPNGKESEHDFDISDIGDALRINHDNDDPTNMDEDSLESCEGVLDNKSKPIFSEKKPESRSSLEVSFNGLLSNNSMD